MMNNDHSGCQLWWLAIWLPVLVLFGGCSVAPGIRDPWVNFNRPVDRLNDRLDRALLQPAAKAYTQVAPKPVRGAVSRVIANAAYPSVIVNDWLQGKAQQGLADTARLLLNSTVGVLGLFDVATAVGLIAHEEDFGQTLGVWGLNRDIYVVVPFAGPNTVVNLPDFIVASVLDGASYIAESSVQWPVFVLKVLDKRARLEEAVQLRDRAALDTYAFTRDSYIQRRQYLLYDGHPPLTADFDE